MPGECWMLCLYPLPFCRLGYRDREGTRSRSCVGTSLPCSVLGVFLARGFHLPWLSAAIKGFPLKARMEGNKTSIPISLWRTHPQARLWPEFLPRPAAVREANKVPPLTWTPCDFHAL